MTSLFHSDGEQTWSHRLTPRLATVRIRCGRPGKQDIVFFVDMTVQVSLEWRKAVVEGLE